MTNMMLRLTPISLSLFVAFSSNAALYNVVPVQTPNWIKNNYTGNISLGAAIQDSERGSCFTSASVGSHACDAFLLAGETRLLGSEETIGTSAGVPLDGLSFRDEAPFRMDNAFSYIQDEDDFYSYCVAYLGYSTCDSWAQDNWQPWYSELTGSQTPNALAFLEGEEQGDNTSNEYAYRDDFNSVINQVTENGELVGIRSSLGDARQTVEAISPQLPSSGNYSQSRAWKTNGTYTVGSIANTVTNDYGTHFSSKAAIWRDGQDPVEIAWNSGIQNRNERLAQGSMRDFVVVNGTIYGVGFNTWNSSYNFMNAAVFAVSETNVQSSSQWTSRIVSNVEVTQSDRVYTNSLLTGINENLVAIGEAKRNTASSGAYANRPFLIEDVSNNSTLNAEFFADKITFAEAGGHASAINNYNEIVGQIDVDSTVREVNGKPRRKRGFIYPYDGTNSDRSRLDRFGDKGWLLDDLTNDGSSSSNNNAYRIVSANDINDAGVIAATALYCAGGYDSTAHDAQCGNGTGVETTVAVKLVPILNATSDDIVERNYETSALSSERKGASFGLWALGVLSLILLGRRKRILLKSK